MIRKAFLKYLVILTICSVMKVGAADLEQSLSSVVETSTSQPIKQRVCITFGTFDLFHIGHLNMLKRAKSFGDKLVVGVSTDDLNFKKKQRYPTISQEERLSIVSELRCVDETFFEESLEEKAEYIKKYQADIFVIGDDWQGKFDYLASDVLKVIYLPRTEGISTTELLTDIPIRDPSTQICIRTTAKQNYREVPSSKTVHIGLYKVAQEIETVLTRYKVNFFWTSGTLLGAVRSGGVLQWDNDLDLNLLDEDYTNIEAALQELTKIGYDCQSKTSGWAGYQLYYHLEDGNRAQCDIFKAPKSPSGVHRFPTGWPKYYFSDKEVYPLKKAKFGNVEITIPNLYHVILYRNFGHDYFSHTKKYDHSGVVHEQLTLMALGDELPAGPFKSLPNSLDSSPVGASEITIPEVTGLLSLPNSLDSSPVGASETTISEVRRVKWCHAKYMTKVSK